MPHAGRSSCGLEADTGKAVNRRSFSASRLSYPPFGYLPVGLLGRLVRLSRHSQPVPSARGCSPQNQILSLLISSLRGTRLPGTRSVSVPLYNVMDYPRWFNGTPNALSTPVPPRLHSLSWTPHSTQLTMSERLMYLIACVFRTGRCK